MVPLVFSAYFISLIGDSLFKIAFPLFIYALTKNAFYTSLACATQFLRYMLIMVLIMPFMGELVDFLSQNTPDVGYTLAAEWLELQVLRTVYHQT